MNKQNQFNRECFIVIIVGIICLCLALGYRAGQKNPDYKSMNIYENGNHYYLDYNGEINEYNK